MFFHKHDFNSFRSEDSRQYLLKPKVFINLSCFLSIYLSLSHSHSLSVSSGSVSLTKGEILKTVLVCSEWGLRTLF